MLKSELPFIIDILYPEFELREEELNEIAEIAYKQRVRFEVELSERELRG